MSKQPVRRVLFVANDHVGERMAGPGIRAVNLARQLASEFEVTLAAPNEAFGLDDLELLQLDVTNGRTVRELAVRYDAVVAQYLPPSAMLALAGTPVRVIYDLYDPVILEALAMSDRRIDPARSRLQLAHGRLVQETALLTGDAFCCASERQRDFYLGSLAIAGRLTAESYNRDPSLRGLVDVVPFGLESTAPSAGPSTRLRGVLPGMDARSKILLWGGGIWPWLDPLTVIRAVDKVAETHPDVRLVFMGLGRPNASVADDSAALEAVRLTQELGIRDRLVHFNEGWVPYEERGRWLVEADIGVSAHFADAETRLAFRTRLLDYFWAGLPTVTTAGDELGDLVGKAGLGAALPAGDVDAWVAALCRLLNSPDELAATRARVKSVRGRFAWKTVAQPLARLVHEQGRTITLPRRAHLHPMREAYVRGRISLLHRGIVAGFGHAVGNGARAAAGRSGAKLP